MIGSYEKKNNVAETIYKGGLLFVLFFVSFLSPVRSVEVARARKVHCQEREDRINGERPLKRIETLDQRAGHSLWHGKGLEPAGVFQNHVGTPMDGDIP